MTMRNQCQILNQGTFDPNIHVDFEEDAIERIKYKFKIQSFIISPNSKLLVIISSKQTHRKLIKRFLIVIINIWKNKIIFEENRMFSDTEIFCEISYDSRYLIYHSQNQSISKILNILDLSDLKYIYRSYTLDEQNQIYLSKDNYIQIYSIDKNSFKKSIFGSDKMVIKAISKQLFLEIDDDRFKVFSIQNQSKHVIKQMKTVQDDVEILWSNYSFYKQNKLLIIEHLHDYQEQIHSHYQLRNVINGKLLRNFISQHEQSQGILDNKFFYICELLENKIVQLIYRLNLILGQDQQMRFQINNELDTPLITKQFLFDFGNNIFRYYIYE